jgi:hypothetical protein
METCDWCKRETDSYALCKDCADVVCEACANFIDGTVYCNDCVEYDTIE